MRRVVVALVAMAFAPMAFAVAAVAADDLRTAQELAWAKQFAESEAMYRRILAAQPASRDAQLGLARVVMWQGRYAEAIALFAKLDGVDALEGRATAEYWSGDYRGAARHFRRVLQLDPRRDFARQSLAEIASTTRPEQRAIVDGSSDDQPLDIIRTRVAATFFSDPLTRWTAEVGGYDIHPSGLRVAGCELPGPDCLDDAARATRYAQLATSPHTRGGFASIANETKVKTLTFGGSAGVFTWPDGVRRPIGSASLRHRSLTLRVDRQPELATATSIDRHIASTTTTLRWDHDRDRDWLAAAEVNHRSYSDDNSGSGFSAYAIAPLRRDAWTLWGGASAAARDTRETRFTFEGRYDPYWTPENLVEGRAVVAIERALARGTVKVHADGGRARDRGRTYSPWRAGIAAGIELTRGLRIEAQLDRSATVDYRVTSFHAALVRRR